MRLIDALKRTAQRCKDYVDSKHVELDNAIETHGIGYTTEEPVPAINITWDGDTEGRESVFENTFFKILDNDIPDSVIEGGNVEYIYGENVFSGDAFIDAYPFPAITSFGFHNESAAGGAFNSEIIIIHEDINIEGTEVSKGVYFHKETSDVYISSFTKEASTVETVHKIDEKYIPSSGGAMVVNASFSGEGVALDKTYDEISSALPNVVVNVEGTGDVQVQYILPYTFSMTDTENDVTVLYFSAAAFYQSHVGIVGYSEITINSSNEVEAKFANLQEAVLS